MDVLRGDRGTWNLDMTPYVSPRSAGKGMQQGEAVGDEIVRGDSDGAGNKESTSTEDIRMARNISREDNKEETNYNTKDLNDEALSAVETQSLKQNSQNTKSTTDHFSLRSFSSALSI